MNGVDVERFGDLARIGASQQCLHPSQKFGLSDGLLHVFVSPLLKGADDVLFRVAIGHEHDRYRV